jgi:hypothetical protein
MENSEMREKKVQIAIPISDSLVTLQALCNVCEKMKLETAKGGDDR